ncbi:MAG: hypothetical protein PHP93_02910 [Kiritimatiellales bacterium]|nr:hypothetical protein [Kiritimatiellales bacterium]
MAEEMKGTATAGSRERSACFEGLIRRGSVAGSAVFSAIKSGFVPEDGASGFRKIQTTRAVNNPMQKRTDAAFFIPDKIAEMKRILNPIIRRI